MNKILFTLLILTTSCSLACAQGSGGMSMGNISQGPTLWGEEDASPDNLICPKLKFGNGNVTDNGDGTCSIGNSTISSPVTISGSGERVAGTNSYIDFDDGGAGTVTIGGLAGTNNEFVKFDFETIAEQVIVTFSTNAKFSTLNSILYNLSSQSAPTTDEAGEYGFDNNAWASGRGTIQLYDGTANTYLVGALASDTPTNGQRLSWNTGGTVTWEDDADSSGITAADTLVIYSDGANNPVGDADFSWNKTTNVLTVGSVVTAPSTTPTTSYTDSDTTDGDVSTQVVTNCTDTGSNTEDCDYTISQQIAGAMTPFITANADGSVTITRLASTNATLVTPALGTPASGVMTNVTGIPAGAFVAAAIDGDDVNTNIAGRSLALTSASPDTLDADAELYTVTKCAIIETPTSADDFMFYHVELGMQITAVHCIVEDATNATIDIKQCDVAGDNCAAVTTSIICDVGGQADDGVIDAPDLDVDDWVRLDVTATTGTPGAVTACFTATMDD